MESPGATPPSSDGTPPASGLTWPETPGVVIAAALDTKGTHVAYLRERLRAQGLSAIVIDCGLRGGCTAVAPDIGGAAIAQLAGADIAELRASTDRAPALKAILAGLERCVGLLDARGLVLGVIGLGGGTNATMAARAFAALRYGCPKVLVSTVVSGDTRPFIGGSDAVLIHSVVDFIGLSAPLCASLDRAAVTMKGLIGIPFWPEPLRRPVIGVTANGATTAGAEVVEAWLGGQGAETWVFHARGSGGIAFERLIGEGRIEAALDFATTEVADELLGGLRSAGPTRLDAAAAAGIPQVVVPGCVDVVNFSEPHTVPPRYSGRSLIHHTPSSVLMRTLPEENREIGAWIGGKLARARGPAAVLIPMRGFSSYDAPGSPYHDPAAAMAFAEGIAAALTTRPDIPVRRYDLHINDAEFARTACTSLWDLLPCTIATEPGDENGQAIHP